MGACFSTIKINKNVNNEAEKKLRVREKQSNKAIPCGKRTDFGYDKDFDIRYTIGKLLGHGQFGYTYVATDKANGDRVAVKRIEKNKLKTLRRSLKGFLPFVIDRFSFCLFMF
ncbi:hypothetical protein OIU84_029791 [Salix udensis]|uniref:Protein kinase domain-containing protein n=1 Tax=Salix udensis TaxID=889485 RepID=A0AAD6KAD8_9ROSI|nr:hypothetical protein OIU84_029791 [Salix udensis]